MPAKYKDSSGKEWPIVMTIGLARRMCKSTGFDFVSALYDPDKAYELIGKIYQELGKFSEAICIACKVPEDQIDEFLDGMSGEDVARAFEAMDEAFTNFYQPGKREMIARWKEQFKEEGTEQQQEILQEVDQKVQEQMEKRREKRAQQSQSTLGK